MRRKLAHVDLPYKNRNYVKIMGLLYVFTGKKKKTKNVNKKVEVWVRHKISTSEKLPWYIKCNFCANLPRSPLDLRLLRIKGLFLAL